TLCEVNGELVIPNESNVSLQNLDRSGYSDYPNVHIALENFRKSTGSSETAQSAFLDQPQSLWCRVQATYKGHGVSGVLNEICNSTHEDEVPSFVISLSKYILSSLRWFSGMQWLSIFPHINLSNEDLIASFSQNSNWINSPIRLLSWHSKANKFALALKDDTVRIYYSDNDLIPTLKHKLQRNVCDLQWKPFCSSILAVAAQTAILIWSIDPCSLSSRPYSGAVQVLSYAGHSPVSSVAWSPYGYDQLFSASALNSALLVWDVSLKEPQVIQHISRCGGITRLQFSSDGGKVLASTPSSSFRVFETSTWKNERWSKLSGRVQSACWSSDGTILLFALISDPRIYSLTFGNSKFTEKPVVDGSKHATVVLDLMSEEAPHAENVIHSMVWDETGFRLAVMFDKSDPRHSKVALFAISSNPVFSITMKGFIDGKADSIPCFIAFKPNCLIGACLTICYSDGDVTYVPLHF
uniref:Aladin seven-bladed propeller domain-containing protein n=1 Tax=Ciona savignyi TaxID=51511 RepID=H2YW86_CIOSA